MTEPTFDTVRDSGSPRVALVTGANKGIGFETARQLGALGITVLVGSRDPERGAEAVRKLDADGVTAVAIPLDVTDPDSVAAAAARIDRDHGWLDILVNNAGILVGWGRPSELAVDELRQACETNVFGMMAVTNAMLPALRRSAAGRIVNLSSSMGSLTQLSAPDGGIPVLAYSVSKSAVNALTVAYAAELRDSPIKVNSADPGYCATDLNRHTGPRSPEQGARVVVRLATLPEDGPTGGFFDEDGPVPW